MALNPFAASKMAFHPFLSAGRPLHGFHELWPSPPIHRPQYHHESHQTKDDADWMIMPVIPNLIRDSELILQTASPGYEIHEANGKYMICVDVPGIKAADIAVQVEDDGKFLHIAGSRQTISEGDGSETKKMVFSKRFTIGSHMDIDHMTANLEDGVLTLTAPVKEKAKIPIHTVAVTEAKSDEKEN